MAKTAMKKTTKKAAATEPASKKYAEIKAQVESIMKRIESGLAAHAEKQERRPEDWSHVGDLGYIATQLNDVAAMLKV